MRFRKLIGKIEVYGGIKRMTWVDGVNSKLPDGRHFLLWDFDDVPLHAVVKALRETQAAFMLSPVNILSTGKPNSWHAYCFTRLPWERAFEAVWHTKGVCPTYLKMAFVRGYFTLRYSDKSGRSVAFKKYLASPFPDNVDPRQINNFVRYLTKGG